MVDDLLKEHHVFTLQPFVSFQATLRVEKDGGWMHVTLGRNKEDSQPICVVFYSQLQS